MISLQPGQNAPLAPHQKLSVTAVITPKGQKLLQPMAFLLGADEKTRDAADIISVDYPESENAAVRFDRMSGQFFVDLVKIPESIQKVAFTLVITTSITRGVTFSIFSQLTVEIASESGESLLDFPIALENRPETALILVELYRYEREWKCRALGQGFTNGLNGLLVHFGVEVTQQQPSALPPVAQPPQTRLISGTGFCINPGGFFVTSHHVIHGAARIWAVSARGRAALAPIFVDPVNDLALLRIEQRDPGLMFGVVEFRDSNLVELGEKVVVVGYPMSGLLGSGPQVATGVVSSLIGLYDDTRSLQFTAPVQAGNSGGPLLDSTGALIGVVAAKLDAQRIQELTGDVPQNVNFAIKNAMVRTFLDAFRVDYTCLPPQRGTHLSTAEIAHEANRFVVRIECRG